MAETSASDSPPEGTRATLIAAGLHLFGRHGFAGTSTRDLAARAGTNVASIAYHFGGKAGLHMACANELARRIRVVIGAPVPPPPMTPAEAAGRLEAMLRAMVAFLVAAPGADDMVTFILREMAGPSEAIDTIYEALFEPKHRECCALWAMATGADPDSEAVRLAVFAMIGQIVYFRIGRPIVLRRMGWADTGRAEAEAIADVLCRNLRAMLEARP